MADPVPRFALYGEPDRGVAVGFLHVERVMTRGHLHQGQVEAHTHDQMGQITYWVSGSGRYFIEEQGLDFCAPAISFVPSRVVHGFKVAPGSDAIVLSIADGALSAVGALTPFSLAAPVFLTQRAEDPAWARLARLMAAVEESHALSAGGAQDVTAGLAVAVLGEMRQLAAGADAARPVPPLAAALRQMVERQFRSDWSVQHYAQALATTPYLLGAASKAAFGLTVKDLISARRLLEAKRLLLFTIRPLEDIAAEVGLPDPAYFSRFFRARTGEAPSAWRRRHMANTRD